MALQVIKVVQIENGLLETKNKPSTYIPVTTTLTVLKFPHLYLMRIKDLFES